MELPALIVLSFLIAAACAAVALLRPELRVQLAVTAVLAGGLCYALTHVLFAGGVLLHDPTGALRSAAIVSNGESHGMRRLIAGYYYGEPAGDASLRLTFADGHSADHCYLTPGMPVWVEVGQPLRC